MMQEATSLTWIVSEYTYVPNENKNMGLKLNAPRSMLWPRSMCITVMDLLQRALKPLIESLLVQPYVHPSNSDTIPLHRGDIDTGFRVERLISAFVMRRLFYFK